VPAIASKTGRTDIGLRRKQAPLGEGPLIAEANDLAGGGRSDAVETRTRVSGRRERRRSRQTTKVEPEDRRPLTPWGLRLTIHMPRNPWSDTAPDATFTDSLPVQRQAEKPYVRRRRGAVRLAAFVAILVLAGTASQ
jgi:hypothetical protein